MSFKREDLIYMSKASEQTERFEEMLGYMKQVVNQGGDLSTEERNLLSIAYKNSVGSRRSAWRALEAIEHKDDHKGGSHKALIKELKRKVKEELDNLCNDALQLIENKIVPNATAPESKIFFLKMKGDYYRYLAECATEQEKQTISSGGLKAYQDATAIATETLKSTDPVRLGLALNFSVFHYEILNNPTAACELAKEAFDEAISKIEELNDDEYKDSTTIMQLIRDNLTLWSSELEGEGEGNEEQ